MALRWAVAGPGCTANDFITALSTLTPGNHLVVAVASRTNRSVAERFFEHHRSMPYGERLISEDCKIYTSYDELAADQRVQVVYVATVHALRHQGVAAAQRQGKACLVENPMTINARMARIMIERAKETRVFLMEALWSRFMPAYHYLADVVAKGNDGPIGEAKLVLCNIGYKERPCLPLDRLKEHHMAGGALMDIGIYGLNVVNIVFNRERPQKIVAAGTLFDTNVDEMVSITLIYSSNRMAVLTVTVNTSRPPNEAHIIGSKGRVKLCSPYWCATRVEHDDGTVREFPLPAGDFNFANSAGLAYQADEVRECLLSGRHESTFLSLADSLLFREITDEVRRQLGVVFKQDKDTTEE